MWIPSYSRSYHMIAIRVITSVLASVYAIKSNAEIVTFNGTSHNRTEILLGGDSYVEAAFVFKNVHDKLALVDSAFHPQLRLFDDDVLWFDVFFGTPSVATVEHEFGSPFKLASLTGGGVDLGTVPPTSGLRLIGHFAAGGQISQDILWPHRNCRNGDDFRI